METPSPAADRTAIADPRPGIVAAIAAISVVGTALGLGLPLFSLVLESRGASSTFIGLNAAVAGVVSLVVSWATTPLARRFGTARLLIWSIALGAVTFPMFYLAPALWMWFPLRLVFHGAIMVAFVLSEFWINALAPVARRGLVMGIYATFLSIGFGIGPMVLSATGSGSALPFVIGTAIFLVALVPAFLAAGSVPVLTRAPGHSFVGFIFAVPMATFGAMIFGAVESGTMAMLPVYGLKLGYDEAGAALLTAAVPLGNVLFLIPIGVLADRFDRRAVLIACAAVGFAGALAMPLAAQSFWALAAVLLVWGGIIAGLYTVGLTYLAARFSTDDLVTANAAFAFMYAVGMLIGPASIGAALDVSQHGFALAVGALFAVYLVVATARIVSLRR